MRRTLGGAVAATMGGSIGVLFGGPIGGAIGAAAVTAIGAPLIAYGFTDATASENVGAVAVAGAAVVTGSMAGTYVGRRASKRKSAASIGAVVGATITAALLGVWADRIYAARLARERGELSGAGPLHLGSVDGFP